MDTVRRSVKGPALRTASSVRETSGKTSEIQRFDALVAELSAAMSQVPAQAVDQAIERWLGTICMTLDLDRSAIYERDAADAPVRTTHTWVREDVPAFPRDFDPEKLAKSTASWIFQGNQLVFSRPGEIPPEFVDVRRFVNRYGPKASAIIPMFAGGHVIGSASFGRFRSPREWPDRLLQQLALIVRIFGGAIERKQAAIAAGELHSELTLAQRRTTAGELVGSLAHELNQPLGAILSHLEGLARLLAQPAPSLDLAAKAVRHAIADTRRAGDIVRRVRALFRKQAGQRSALGVSELVAGVVELAGNEAAFRGIELRNDYAGPIRVMADRIEVQQCLLNLLMNGFDAVAQNPSGQRWVSIAVEPERPGWLALTVRDNGPGIDRRVAPRLFEPFVTTKADGMGLGLLVTRSIVEAHGGKLWRAANHEPGAAFTFTLPIAPNVRASRAPTRRKAVD